MRKPFQILPKLNWKSTSACEYFGDILHIFTFSLLPGLNEQ